MDFIDYNWSFINSMLALGSILAALGSLFVTELVYLRQLRLQKVVRKVQRDKPMMLAICRQLKMSKTMAESILEYQGLKIETVRTMSWRKKMNSYSLRKTLMQKGQGQQHRLYKHQMRQNPSTELIWAVELSDSTTISKVMQTDLDISKGTYILAITLPFFPFMNPVHSKANLFFSSSFF